MWFLVLMALAVALTAASGPQGFDVDRALADVVVLAGDIGDRWSGGEGEQLAAGWLAGRLTSMGYVVRIQPFRLSHRGQNVAAMNVVAAKPGMPGYGTLYIGAHYDSLERFPGIDLGGPGANDNASGVATVLEVARLMATQNLSPTLEIVAFGAEEDNLAGSGTFVRRMDGIDRISAIGMLNLDCVGLGDRLDLVVYRAEDRAFAESLGVDADNVTVSTAASSDHVSFADANIPAVLFNVRLEESACGPDYHRSGDTPDKVRRQSLGRAGEALLTAIRSIATQSAPKEIVVQFLPLVTVPD